MPQLMARVEAGLQIAEGNLELTFHSASAVTIAVADDPPFHFAMGECAVVEAAFG